MYALIVRSARKVALAAGAVSLAALAAARRDRNDNYKDGLDF